MKQTKKNFPHIIKFKSVGISWIPPCGDCPTRQVFWIIICMGLSLKEIRSGYKVNAATCRTPLGHCWILQWGNLWDEVTERKGTPRKRKYLKAMKNQALVLLWALCLSPSHLWYFDIRSEVLVSCFLHVWELLSIGRHRAKALTRKILRWTLSEHISCSVQHRNHMEMCGGPF